MKYLFALLCFSCIVGTVDAAPPVSFEREVLPLLEKRCNRCHHPEQQRGGLDLTRIDTIRRGGDELGAAIVPGKPDESPLLQVLTGAKEPKMPENGEPLPANEIDTLRRWIAEGAKDDTPVFAAEDVVFFEREIRPVLVTRCFKCHAGDEPEHGLRLTSRHGILNGGVRGPAAVVGQPNRSLLVRAIRHEGDLQMPRGGDRLSDTLVAAFETWIAKGLPWPNNERVLARARQFTISDADRNHWSFKPLPPHDTSWNIDTALQVHHTRLGITAAAEADRHRLLRRVTYDLIGYPPTPEETAAFVADRSPDAYDKVVTRLLDSPLFGWRWGRHWLDWTRNGVNQQSNRGPAIDSTRYAKWVATCLNEDRPWDWFARVHLAGDTMPAFDGSADYSLDQALAATIPINGQRTFEEVYTDTFRLMDKLDESVEFLGRSLLGISLECARCHDHKFDPISQRDYYALLGFFQSSWFAPVPTTTRSQAAASAAVETFRKLLAERSREQGRLNLASLKTRVGAAGTAKLKAWKESRFPEITARERRLIELEIEILLAEKAIAKNASLAADVQLAIDAARKLLTNYEPPLVEGRFWQIKFHGIGGHKSELGLIKRAKDVGREKLVPELEEQLAFWTAERERWSERSLLAGYAATDPEVAELVAARQRIAQIDEQLPISNLSYLFEPLKSGYIHVRCDGGLRRAEDLIPARDLQQTEGVQINSNFADRAWLEPFYVGDARLLRKGDVLEPAELVPRSVPQFFGGKLNTLQGSGRRQLADWLTAPGSIQAALVARSTVNRAWQHLFGEALCRTPAELGRLGTTPELPELIDGLATQFVAQGWSTKRLVRTIVTSAAYRRSAQIADSARSIDPANRYFARQNVRRLEYEPIVSTFAWLQTGERFGPFAERLAALRGSAELASLFDAPTPYTLIERRPVSISAGQALFVMNSAQGFRNAAGELVNRLRLRMSTGCVEDLDQIYAQVLQRPPDQADREFAANFVARRREKLPADPRAETIEFTSLLLAGNEILFVE